MVDGKLCGETAATGGRGGVRARGRRGGGGPRRGAGLRVGRPDRAMNPWFRSARGVQVADAAFVAGFCRCRGERGIYTNRGSGRPRFRQAHDALRTTSPEAALHHQNETERHNDCAGKSLACVAEIAGLESK